MLLLGSGIPPTLAQGITKKSILVLNSYHKDYKWSDNIVEGITSVFGPSSRSVDLQVEYMDTHRISDNNYIYQLSETYNYKFQGKNLMSSLPLMIQPLLFY